MKWIILLILTTTVMAASTPHETLILVDGGSMDHFIVARWPLFNYFTQCELAVSITNPTATTYYTNTLNLTTTVTGETGVVNCSFTVNGGGDNTHNCINRQVTFPEGTVTIIFTATDEICKRTDTITFTIINKGGGMNEVGLSNWFIVGILIILFLPGKKEEKRASV